jgi:hypothetical protein
MYVPPYPSGVQVPFVEDALIFVGAKPLVQPTTDAKSNPITKR